MPYLTETVASIQAQTFTDWEYLIVDDASEDDTTSWVEAAASKDSRIRLLRQSERGGPFVAANAGLRASRGVFVARIDADDLSPPTRIEKQVRVLSENNHWNACITNKLSFNEHGLIHGSGSHLPAAPQALKWIFAMGTRATHSSLCFRRESVVELGGYRPLPAASDYHLITSLALSDRLFVLPETLSHVRRHARRLSKVSGSAQNRLGHDLAKEHLLSLTGQDYSLTEIEALWAVGAAGAYDVRLAMKAFSKWRQAWGRSQLSSEAMADLKACAGLVRRDFLRANLRSNTAAVLREWLRCKNPPIPVQQ